MHSSRDSGSWEVVGIACGIIAILLQSYGSGISMCTGYVTVDKYTCIWCAMIVVNDYLGVRIYVLDNMKFLCL